MDEFEYRGDKNGPKKKFYNVFRWWFKDGIIVTCLLIIPSLKLFISSKSIFEINFSSFKFFIFLPIN